MELDFLEKRCLKKIEKECKNPIYELFRISQYKTGNKFRKSHLSEPLGEFLTFP